MTRATSRWALFRIVALGAVALGLATGSQQAASSEKKNYHSWRNGQAIFEILLGEFAIQHKDLPLAGRIYDKLANKSKDSAAFGRAIEIASHQQDDKRVMRLSRLWVKAEPDNLSARKTLVAALVRKGQGHGLIEQIKYLLKHDKTRLPNSLLGLNNLFNRFKDKQAVMRMVGQLTAPYLEIPESQLARAIAAVNAKDIAAALNSSSAALALRPDWHRAALLKASLLARQSSNASIQFLNDYLLENPQAREVRLQLARRYAANKQYDQSREQFEFLLENKRDDPKLIYPLVVLSMQGNDLTYTKKLLNRLLKLETKDPGKVRFFIGQLAEQEKDSKQAITEYEKVTDGSQYLAARIAMAKIHAREDRLEMAREILQNSLGLNERERVQLWLSETQLLREAKQNNAAAEVLLKGLKKYPDQPELLYESALTDEKLEDIDSMEKKLRRLIKLQPNNAHAKNALGYSFADRNIRLSEAYKLIVEALDLRPKDPYIMDSLGWVHYRRGDLGKAIKLLRKALEIRPDPEIAAHLGEVLWKTNKTEEANKLWQKAVIEHPDNELLNSTIQKFNSGL